jgi:exodeoxyribonuclease VII large subunit
VASLAAVSLPLFDGPRRGEPPRPVTLVRLAGEIARAAGGVGVVAVEGEVHRPTRGRSGWLYLVLRDRAAQVQVIVPRAVAAKARVVNGERVCVVGGLEWSAERGSLSLRASEISPVGAGAVAAQLAETRARLAAAGLTTRPRRPLPLLPARVGVVCGTDAAVRRDIESVVAARFPGYPLVIEEATVSGPGAAVSIVDALRAVCGRPGVEVVILARGGGDATALLPWSDEDVCRAVAGCPVPVVSAIGHEGDRPLCDEVADHRCGTPSIAAAAVVPDREALGLRLDGLVELAGRSLEERVARGVQALGALVPSRSLDRAMEAAAGTLAAGGRRLADVDPSRRVLECRRRLDAVDWRRPTGEILGRAAGRLEAGRRHLGALDPQRVLARGYAVVTGPDGAVVRRAASVRVGDRLGVRLAEGHLGVVVEEVGRRG